MIDPELDEPITDLGFVQSVERRRRRCRCPTCGCPPSFCSPNFAYLMASDAKDAIAQLEWVRRAVVQLDDHHDSDLINAGLAADAASPAPSARRPTAISTSCGGLPAQGAHRRDGTLSAPVLRDPTLDRGRSRLGCGGRSAGGRRTTRCCSRRARSGFPMCRTALVFVDDQGHGYPRADACSDGRGAQVDPDLDRRQRALLPGLLITRYPGSAATRPRVTGAGLISTRPPCSPASYRFHISAADASWIDMR